MADPSSKSTQAFSRLLDTLREAMDTYLTPEYGATSPQDTAEGFRYILHMLSAGIDLYAENDPDHPEFMKVVSPTRKLMGDNPDAIYHFSRIRGDRSYRITGRKSDECYLSFTIHGRPQDGRLGAAAEPVLADVNDRSLNIAPDGSFEVILSPDEHAGNWIKLDPSAASVITRHYYELEGTPAAEPDRRVELHIEPLTPPPTRSPLTDEAIARRIDDIAAFVRGGTIDMPVPGSIPIPFVSTTPNELPQPMVFRMAGQDAWGAVDIAYSMGPFKIGPQEALVITGTLPDCAFANVVLWNKFMQSFEFRDRRVSLNRKQIVPEPDGSYRIVVAHSDPGVPNWLDTEGHTEGTIFWRILLPTEQPAKPECALMPLSEIRREA